MAATAHRLHDDVSTVRSHSEFQRVYGGLVTRWRRQISLSLGRANADCVLRAVDNARGGRTAEPLFGAQEDEYSLLSREFPIRPS